MANCMPVPNAPIAGMRMKDFLYDSPRHYLRREFQLVLSSDEAHHEDTALKGRLMSNAYLTLGGKDFLRGWARATRQQAARVRRRLSGSDNYIAVSYSWGSNSQRFPLYLSTVSCRIEDGKQVVMDHQPERNGYIWITASLRAFLVEMKRRQENRFMWIDAICIDQNSQLDKAYQIPNMRHVYEQASSVYVWLGDASMTELAALRYLPNCLRRFYDLGLNGRGTLTDAFVAAGLPEPGSSIWKAYANILSRTWWDRLWTLQEVVMARNAENAVPHGDGYRTPAVQVFCGNSSTPWEHFDQFALELARLGLKEWLFTGKMGVMFAPLHGIDAISEVRTARVSKQTHFWAVSPSAALVATRRRTATVPADYVFGQLAMLDADTIKELALDISMSKEEIFTRFAKHYIRNEVKECLLNPNATFEKLLDLPSWCVNFASKGETKSIGSRWLTQYREEAWLKKQLPCAGFQKEGKWKLPRSRWYHTRKSMNVLRARSTLHDQYNTDDPRQITILPESNCILAKGIELDIVSEIVECNQGAETFFSHNSIVQALAWDQACFGLAQRTLRLPDSTTSTLYYDVYARTLVANLVDMNIPLLQFEPAKSLWSYVSSPPAVSRKVIFDRFEKVHFAPRYLSWRKFMEVTIATGETVEPGANMDGETASYVECLWMYSRRRRFFATRGGKIGMGPSNAQVGDKVVVIFYCPTPYLLRPSKANEGQWEFVGEAYVRGYMYGEALEMFDRGEVNETQWVIC